MQNSFLNILLFIILSVKTVCSQQHNYREIFGRDWDKALSFVKENEIWLRPVLDKYNVSYPEAIAVIFPELVRYSALRDKIEITLLKALYINLGAEYANFSVGPMQMKPSFAERIHENSGDAKVTRTGKLFRIKSDFTDIKDYRASIISDLENPEREVIYLIAFIKICEKNFNLKSMNDTDRVRFLATAYNYGFWNGVARIENMSDKKFFSTTLIKTETYSYSDISLFWFKHYLTFY